MNFRRNTFGLVMFAGLLLAQSIQPDGRLIWSQELGRFDSREAVITFVALAAETTLQAGRKTNGIQIDITSGESRESMFLDKSIIEAERDIFDKLSRDWEAAGLGKGPKPGFLGSCEFQRNPEKYPLKADYNFSGPQAPGTRIITPSGRQFLFPKMTPGDISAILSTALTELGRR